MHFPLSNRRTKTETELRLMDLHAKNSPVFLLDADIAPGRGKNTGEFLPRESEQRNSVHMSFFQITEGKAHELNYIPRLLDRKIYNQLFWIRRGLLDLVKIVPDFSVEYSWN
jgi:hypothetical protein